MVSNRCRCACAPNYTGPTCSALIRACDNIKCQNNGVCVNLSPTSFRCDCKDGYSGVFCEKSICDTSPCQRGSCKPSIAGNYHCTCPQRYIGKNCSNGKSINKKKINFPKFIIIYLNSCYIKL